MKTMHESQATRALLVEHHSTDVQAITTMLVDAAPGFDLVRADRLPAAMSALQTGRFGLVLVDAGVLGDAGLTGLDSLNILAGGAPVVVLSGHADSPSLGEALRHGATAVLVKDDAADQLAGAVRTVLKASAFQNAVKDALRTARRHGSDIAVLQVHLHGWTQLASRWTAADLDVVRRAVTERLAGRLPTGDALMDLGDGRYGVIAPDTATELDTRRLALELMQALERPVDVAGQAVSLGAACGWVLAPVNAPTADAVVRESAPATEILGTVDPADPAPAVAAPGPRRGFARRLRAAIAAGELVLHYQPIIRLGDDTIQVVEALVRWCVPGEDGTTHFLPPAEFIPLAEETGAIEEIGAFALSEACRQLREWDKLGLAPIRVAVNLSARELCSPALPARVADALAESGLPADRLELELTESMFAEPEETSRMLARLRALGVRVAIDDFGTGYSSLGYLTRFAVDVIKIDGPFVRRAADDDDVAEVLRGIVKIAHHLDLEIVAEGIETLEQLHFVKGEDVDLVQGYLFCEPLPANAAGAWLSWAEDVVRDKAPVPRASRGVRLSRREQVIRSVTLTTGVMLGWLAAWPVEMPAANACPPAGEGQFFCQVQNAWAPAFTVFVAVVAAVFAGVDLSRRAPRVLRRWRDPQWRARRRRRRRRALPAAGSDPILLAASWGVTAPPKTVAAATAAAAAIATTDADAEPQRSA
jgi:EAL domain-containing protein (putative c-di-GMP-specific phosphodiesterase class I)/DNA-binding NarL/FixJ family response regulator